MARTVRAMSHLSTRQLAVYLALGVAVVALGARWLHAQGTGAPAGAARAPAPARAPGVRLETAGGGALVVDVAGEVRRPGVYRLPAGSRVDAAVRRAGGPTRRADLTALNLASRLDDGRQVIVPMRAPGGGAAVAAAGDAGGAGAGTAPATPVNLNTATVDQLTQLDGVGPATAQRIVAYRQQHGGFASVDELDQVPGIGPKKLAAIRPHVSA